MTHAGTIPPHGGTLIDLVLPPDQAAREAEEAANLAKVVVGAREMSDLEMLAVGSVVAAVTYGVGVLFRA